MPPKQDKLDDFYEKIVGKIDETNSRFEKKLDAILESQASIKNRLEQTEAALHNLQNRDRQFNVRIVGLKVPENSSAANYVFNTIIEPILKLAAQNKDCDFISDTPTLIQTISACHPIPTKPDATPAIHVRFTSKLIREAILIHKGRFLKNNPLNASIYEDLTPQMRTLFQQTKAREDVEKCFTRSGRVKFILKGKSGVQTAKLS